MFKYYVFTVLLIFVLLSCDRYPDADFYEVNGIVSIKASSLPDQNNWITNPYYTSVAKVSYEDSLAVAGRLAFSFFVRRPGNYSIWTLTGKHQDVTGDNTIPLRVFDSQRFLIGDFRLRLNETHSLEWLSHDQYTDEHIMVYFPEPGHYSIIFESGGRGGYVIDKLFLSLNDTKKPEGFAYPETNHFRSDPVLLKRDQRVVIPPGWAFGFTAGILGEGVDLIQNLDHLAHANIHPDAVVHSPGRGSGVIPKPGLLNAYQIRLGILIEETDSTKDSGETQGSVTLPFTNENFQPGRFDFAKMWNGADFSDLEEVFTHIKKQGSEIERRGFVLSGLENVYRPEIKEYPVSWSSFANAGSYIVSGNNDSAVAGLKETIGLVANPRKSTYEVPFLALNIGGYYKDISSMDEEEIIRWFQFLSFYTMMYLSSDNEDMLEIMNSLSKETRGYIGELLSHRSELFPYLYSLAHLVRPTGVKPVRGNSDHPTQFFLGNSILVAPVYDKGAAEREVFLPEGTWYHYQHGTEYRGGGTIIAPASLYEIPVFIKSGSIIPYRKRSENVSGKIEEKIRVDIYGGGRGTFRLYQDDEETIRYQLGEFSTTAFRYFEHDDYATFTIGRRVRSYTGQPDYSMKKIVFRHMNEPVLINVNHALLPNESWNYDRERRTLIIDWTQPHYQKTDFFIQF